MRRVYYALFGLAALVLSGWLVIHYDVVTLARAFLAPAARWLVIAGRVVGGALWQAGQLASQPLLRNYVLRRLTAPVWRFAMQAAVVVIGYRAVALLYRQIRKTAGYAGQGVAWWRARHRAIRWAITSGALFGVGLLGLGLYIFPVWLPLPGGFTHRVHYWWMDQVVNRWIAPRRLRFRRLMRTHPLWRIVRRPHRLTVYFVTVAINRGGRRVRQTVVAGWPAGVKESQTALSSPRTGGRRAAA